MQNRSQNSKAFTLIELLIVVAIIAILAAIAVPNFLEAQTRSKVSRTHADLRSVATALEVFRTENNRYPRTELGASLPARLKTLTTPVSYIGAIPHDPFFVESRIGLGGFDPQYVYTSGNIYFGNSTVYDRTEYLGSIYALAGRGPDNDINYGGYCMAHPVARNSGADVRGSYDPTNGTISAGDILRLGSGTMGAHQP